MLQSMPLVPLLLLSFNEFYALLNILPILLHILTFLIPYAYFRRRVDRFSGNSTDLTCYFIPFIRSRAAFIAQSIKLCINNDKYVFECSPSSEIIKFPAIFPKGVDRSPPHASFCAWKNADGELASHKTQWQMPTME